LVVEIIVVNNNSTDRTQEVLNRINVKSYLQTKQGCGPGPAAGPADGERQNIYLMADGDCIYPPQWIEKMTKALQKEGTLRVSMAAILFWERPDKPRWKLYHLRVPSKDVFSEVRHVKRPCVNALGMSMGYVKDLGLKTGFVDRQITGRGRTDYVFS
jgi:glycosyltransferase involved in cell wall biosynthesis